MEEEKKIVGITCRHCNEPFKMYAPSKGGVCKVKCPHCHEVMAVNFGTPAADSQQPSAQASAQPSAQASQQASAQPSAQASQQASAQPSAQASQQKKPTKDMSDLSEDSFRRGKLVQIRGFLQKNISYALVPGDNTIGQYDMGEPSTIMIKDNTISRQSANIKVCCEGDRLDYLFCLLKSKNPVLLNGYPVQVGEERYLNFGDTIVMGQTTLRFEKA